VLASLDADSNPRLTKKRRRYTMGDVLMMPESCSYYSRAAPWVSPAMLPLHLPPRPEYSGGLPVDPAGPVRSSSENSMPQESTAAPVHRVRGLLKGIYVSIRLFLHRPIHGSFLALRPKIPRRGFGEAPDLLSFFSPCKAATLTSGKIIVLVLISIFAADRREEARCRLEIYLTQACADLVSNPHEGTASGI